MKFRKPIIFLIIISMSTSVSYASIATHSEADYSPPLIIEQEKSRNELEEWENSTPSNAQPPDRAESEDIEPDSIPKATPSEANASKKHPSTATPSEATPSTATPSEATPSEATPSQVGTPTLEVEFQLTTPDDVPSWYKKTRRRIFKGKTHYYFTDRFGQEQHRIYGFYEDDSDADWYECDEKGKVTNASQMIDLVWEDMVLAPLRWESIEPMPEDIKSLSVMLFGIEDYIEQNMDFEIINSETGQNYDDTYYDVWCLGGGYPSEQSDLRYFLYGHAVNGEMDDRWIECTEDGTVIEKVSAILPHKVPSWYKEIGQDGTYFFLDRNGQKQYRQYTVLDSLIGWYACDADGEMLEDSPIDLTKEDFDLAPYRYESNPVSTEQLEALSGMLTGDETIIQDENISAPLLLGSNYDDTTYEVLRLSPTGDSSVRSTYYLYGHTINSYDKQDQWYQCDENGAVLGTVGYGASSPVIETMSLARGADVIAEECHITGWNLDTTILAARTSPNGGRLIIDCGLAKKYGNQVAIYSYLGASNNRHKVILFYKANSNWTNLSYYSQTWAEGYQWVYAPIDESAYWYTRSGVNMSSHWNWTINEVNAGGYTYHSESEGSQWATIPMKRDYFKMVLSHKYGAWTTTRPATCTENGIQSRYCSGCGRVETSSLPAIGHTFEPNYYTEANNGTYYRRCTRNGCTGKTDIKNNPYMVAYDANSGEGVMEPQAHTYNVFQALSPNSFFKDYHTFKCWAHSADGSDITYTDSQSVQNLTPKYNDNVTLYAQWEPNTYEITYDDGFDDTQTITKQQKYTEQLGPLPPFTRSGYTLSGFFTSPEGGEAVTEETDVPHNDVTYYAQWEAIDYELLFHVQDSFCGSTKKIITYDNKIGILPTPTLEDFSFHGWYSEPYSSTYLEGIKVGDSYPVDEKKITSDIIYQTAGDTDVYAYMILQFREIENNVNLRPGKDGIFDTEDDNRYLNGLDEIAGTHDDIRIYPGIDGQYGTDDDYYVDDQGRNIYPGGDKIFSSEDDYRDNVDGTNTRPGSDCSFNSPDDIDASNGLDGKPGTSDDWIDNSVYYPDTNLRPGPDGIFGTSDDEVFWNGPDSLPGTEDDLMIHPGMDQEMGTKDDWVDNGAYYPDTNLRSGADGVLGTEDDKVYWNGPDGIPGNADDKLILPGPDGEYGTKDDCYDNSDKQEGTNIRPGSDGLFGTDDDELWLNGPDGIPGTEDDEKYVPKHSSSGSGKKPTKPTIELPEIPAFLPEPLFPIISDSLGSSGYVYPFTYDRISAKQDNPLVSEAVVTALPIPSIPDEPDPKYATLTGNTQTLVQKQNNLWGILKQLVKFLMEHPAMAIATCLALILFLLFIISVLRILTRKQSA